MPLNLISQDLLLTIHVPFLSFILCQIQNSKSHSAANLNGHVFAVISLAQYLLRSDLETRQIAVVSGAQSMVLSAAAIHSL